MAVVAVVTARGGSAGFPGKNLAPFLGRPLVAHAVTTALEAGLDRVLLTTDDDAIAAAGTAAGAELVRRPPELATATSRSVDAVRHAVDAAGVDDRAVVVLLQPTSPLRTAQDVRTCVAAYRGEGSVVEVTPLGGHHPWKACVLVGDELRPAHDWPDLEAPRQELPPAVQPSGGVYVIGAGTLRREGRFFVPPVVAYPIPPERAIDVDSPADLAAAERYARSTNRL